jgi:type IV secretory pathway VirB6-like protein
MTKRLAPVLFLLIAALGLLAIPEPAYAQLDIDVCAPGFMPWHYTSKIVYCIEGMVVQATFDILYPFSNYMVDVLGPMMVLAIIFFSLRIMGGEKELVHKGVFFIVRLGLVIMFAWGLGGLAGYIFDIVNEMVVLVSGGYSPWFQIDAFLGRFIGFGIQHSLDQGLVGIVGAAVFSGTAGTMLGMIGGCAILKMLLFVFRAMFLYLSAIVGIGFLIVISPLVIPTAIFFYTERYLKRWIDMMIATMLVPVLLFATMKMFVNGFGILIEDIFALLGSNGNITDFSAFWKLNQPQAAWMLPTDPQLSGNLEAATQNFGKNVPSVAPNVAPMLRHAHNVNLMNFPGINFGPNDPVIKQNLVYAFMTLLLYTMLINEMLTKIPEIARSIAGATAAVLTDTASLEQNIMNAYRKMQQNAAQAEGAPGTGASGPTVSRPSAGGNPGLNTPGRGGRAGGRR